MQTYVLFFFIFHFLLWFLVPYPWNLYYICSKFTFLYWCKIKCFSRCNNKYIVLTAYLIRVQLLQDTHSDSDLCQTSVTFHPADSTWHPFPFYWPWTIFPHTDHIPLSAICLHLHAPSFYFILLFPCDWMRGGYYQSGITTLILFVEEPFLIYYWLHFEFLL